VIYILSIYQNYLCKNKIDKCLSDFYIRYRKYKMIAANDTAIKLELTLQECEFIVKIISQISISPASKDAAQIVQLVQNLLSKFQTQ